MEADGRHRKTIVFGRLVLKRDVDWAQTTSTGGVGGGVTPFNRELQDKQSRLNQHQ